jgi:hypothetical protein
MDEVAMSVSILTRTFISVAHTRSSSTLCRPDGKALNSTTPSSLTALRQLLCPKTVHRSGLPSLTDFCHVMVYLRTSQHTSTTPCIKDADPLRTSKMTKNAAVMAGGVCSFGVALPFCSFVCAISHTFCYEHCCLSLNPIFRPAM